MADRELLQQALDALDAASSAIVAGICFHENTHRGGVLWTICDDCGQKWADDRGGFKKPTMPKGYAQAQQAASAIRAALGVTPIAPKQCDCAAHSAADCVCGAWDKPALGVVAPSAEAQQGGN